VFSPWQTLQKHFEPNGEVDEYVHEPYFLMRSSSRIRLTCSSLGAGLSVLNIAAISAALGPRRRSGAGGGNGETSKVSRIRRARAMRMGAGQAWTRCSTAAISLFSNPVISHLL